MKCSSKTSNAVKYSAVSLRGAALAAGEHSAGERRRPPPATPTLSPRGCRVAVFDTCDVLVRLEIERRRERVGSRPRRAPVAEVDRGRRGSGIPGTRLRDPGPALVGARPSSRVRSFVDYCTVFFICYSSGFALAGWYTRSVVLASYLAAEAAKPWEMGREDRSTTELATILFFCSSSSIAMDIMETPEPTATPMPMRPPREMMERAA